MLLEEVVHLLGMQDAHTEEHRAGSAFEVCLLQPIVDDADDSRINQGQSFKV